MQPARGCTLADYSATKGFPIEFLKSLDISEITYCGKSALRIPYRDENGDETAVRFRLAIDSSTPGGRFRWRRGDKPLPYGLWKLAEARLSGSITLVEGESDAHTLWRHEYAALGIPGARAWRSDWERHLEAASVIYAVVEPGAGGEAFSKSLYQSGLRDRLNLVFMRRAKDVSALYLLDRSGFRDNWDAALKSAVPCGEHFDHESRVRAEQAWTACRELAESPDILSRFHADLEAVGVVGEERAAKLLYLSVTSRLLTRPVSIALKGPSAAGKSFLTENVLKFFPPSAFYALTAMSERALAYSTEPLSHRMLVLIEAAGMRGNFVSYLVRSLLSEGRIRYETVEKTNSGLRSRFIERPGPTGLIVTTTEIRLHGENETRLLSVPVADTPEQTRRILRALAAGDPPAASLAGWHALQDWLGATLREVVVPFASQLAEAVPDSVVRLRRDFGAVLSLVRSHALLHQAGRERDSACRVVATLRDYDAVRELIGDLVAEGLAKAVSPTIRATVGAVAGLLGPRNPEARLTAVAETLGLDKSAALRRVRASVEAGFLRNLEEHRGRPARLVLGEPLPEDRAVLPHLQESWGCKVAPPTEDKDTPPMEGGGP